MRTNRKDGVIRTNQLCKINAMPLFMATTD
jgi:hypothetical protein